MKPRIRRKNGRIVSIDFTDKYIRKLFNRMKPKMSLVKFGNTQRVLEDLLDFGMAAYDENGKYIDILDHPKLWPGWIENEDGNYINTNHNA